MPQRASKSNLVPSFAASRKTNKKATDFSAGRFSSVPCIGVADSELGSQMTYARMLGTALLTGRWQHR
jgi:hypothetical protein